MRDESVSVLSGPKLLPYIVDPKLLYGCLKSGTRVGSCRITLSNHAVEVASEYNVIGAMPKIISYRVVKKSFPLGAENGTRRRIHIAQRCVVYTQSNQSSVEAFFDVGEFYVIFESDSCSSSRMIDITHDIVAGQGKLFIFYLLQKNDVKFGGTKEGSKSVQFRCVCYCIDVDGADIHAGELHYCCISSPEPRPCSIMISSLCRIFFPGGDRLLRRRRLLFELHDACELSVSLPSDFLCEVMMLPIGMTFGEIRSAECVVDGLLAGGGIVVDCFGVVRVS